MSTERTDGTTYIAYYRVSTQRQGVDGLGMDAQREAVRQYVAQKGGTVLASFEEVESGGRADRPQLAAALERCRLTKSTLVVAKLDRLARDMSLFCRLRDSGLEYVTVDNPGAGVFVDSIRMATAVEERRLISERTKAALAAAKRRGVRLGNPLGVKAFGANAGKGGPEAVKARADKRARSLAGIVLPLYDSGASLRTIATALNDARIPAARGGEWRACSVRRVIARLRPAEAPEIAPEDMATAADAPESRAPGSCTESVSEDLVPDTVAEVEPAAPETLTAEPETPAETALEAKTPELCAEAVSAVNPRMDAVPETAKPEEPKKPTSADEAVPAIEPETPKTGHESEAEPEEPESVETSHDAFWKHLFDKDEDEKVMARERAARKARWWSDKGAIAYTAYVVPENLRTLEEAEDAVARRPWEIRYVPDTRLTPDMCLVVAQFVGRLDMLLEKYKTPAVCMEAVRKNGKALQWVPDDLKTPEMCRIAVEQDAWQLENVPDAVKTPELCAVAVRQKPRAVQFMPERLRTPELCLEAVRQDGMALEFVPETLKMEALCLEAVKQDGLALQYVPKRMKTPDVCAVAVEQYPSALQYVLGFRKTPAMCKDAVMRGGGWVLQWVPERMKTPEICMLAVKNDGEALKFVPEALKTEALCLEAVKQNGLALKYVPEVLKTSEICLVAIRQNAWALFEAPTTTGATLIIEAVRQDAGVMESLRDKYKTPEVCMEAVRQNRKALRWVPDALKATVRTALETPADAVPVSKPAQQAVRERRVPRKAPVKPTERRRNAWKRR